MANSVPQMVAGGDIEPRRFIKVSAAANKTVLVAGATDSKILGISMEGAQDAPAGSNDTKAAVAGDLLKFYGLGDVCELVIGTGGCTAGDYLKPEAAGKGITATLATDFIGAIALETVAADEVALVQIMFVR